MRGPEPLRSTLDAALARLDRDHLVELALDELADLVREPDVDPYRDRRSPERAGVDDLAGTLAAAKQVPDELTVRVLLPPGSSGSVPVDEAERALHRRAAYLAGVSWREAMGVRNMGLRQLPAGLLVALLSAALAYGAGYLASASGSATGVALGFVVAGIAITVAWVVSWMVVESAFIDWRPAARLALAYDLLSRARLEVVAG
jgi:hypothetical protein